MQQTFVLRTQKRTQKVGKKGGKKGSKKKWQKSWQKICQKSTLPYTQHTWLIIRKKHFFKHILEPVLLLS